MTEYGCIKIMSFGFKYGTPRANYYFDVSFTVNPARNAKWGMFAKVDSDMISFVLEQPAVEKFIDYVVPLLRHLATLDGIQVVAFGCNSGRHRSPIIADEVARRLLDLPIKVVHRDVPELEAFSYEASRFRIEKGME